MAAIRSVKLVMGCALAVLLGGCGLFSDDIPPPPCPEVSLLADAAHLVRFRPGGGRDLTDLTFEGEITNYTGSCVYDVDRKTRKGILRVNLAVVINANRGAADKDRAATVAYFVSLLDLDRKPITKQVFETTIVFEGNKTQLQIIDDQPPVLLEIPVDKTKDGRDYRIYIGFQLSPEELELNRRRRNILSPGSKDETSKGGH